MIVNLNNPVEQVVVPEQKVTLSAVTIQRMVDIPGERQVRVVLNELPEPVILWEGDQYQSIGQWTDLQVQERLIELFNGE